MEEVKKGYENKLKSMLYGLLCEYEKNGKWKEMLDSILIQLLGYEEESKTINYYILYYNVSSLRYLRHEYFRKKIFESIGLVGK